jgi:hypothetical protein
MRASLLALVLVLIAGCNHVPAATQAYDAGPNPCAAQPEGLVCFGTQLDHCDGAGHSTMHTDCAASNQICAPNVGCRACVPGQVTCDGETVHLCNMTGTASTTGPTCDPSTGQHCGPGGCADLCAQAVDNHSYIGCEYFPTVLPNSELNPLFRYAIVIANPQLVPAEVQVFQSTNTIAQIVVPPGGLSVQELDWVDALRGDYNNPASVLAVDSTYHVVSDVPVTITQFNPLRYQQNPSCISTRPEDGCFSYTNDASLLLPSHVLTGSYVVMSRPTHVFTTAGGGMSSRNATPGYVAIVNVEDHAISVNVRSTAHTRPSADGTIPALAPGQAHDFALSVGDVLVLETADPGDPCPGASSTDMSGATMIGYCDPGSDWDLTGTQIRTTARVAVFGGHDCTFVPFDRWACDHLEQQMFPVESLGQELFVPITHPLRMGEPNVLRVVAGNTAAHVTFDPMLDDGTAMVDLMPGAFTEHEIRQDVWVRSSAPILGAMFLVGQNYLGFDTIGTMPNAIGDPAMSLVVPTAQYRRAYEFLAPDTYEQSYIDVAIPTGGQIYLDGAPITAMLTTSAAPMSTARIRIPTGPHEIHGDHPFALYVYGFGSYTSYMVPGGMDFVHITMPF